MAEPTDLLTPAVKRMCEEFAKRSERLAGRPMNVALIVFDKPGCGQFAAVQSTADAQALAQALYNILKTLAAQPSHPSDSNPQ